MSAKRVSAVAIAMLFALTSCACLISAEDDTVLMITTPEDEDDPISCAVFFADNMIYTPQWRVDNFVRIEVMVLNMTGYANAEDLLVSDTDLYPSVEYPDGPAQQDAIIQDSASILPLTRMVSVSYIEVRITSDVADDVVLAAGWDPATGAKVIDKNLGHEVNQMGHLIYGTLWDTDGMPEGVYTTEVRLGHVVQDSAGDWSGVLGEWYSVDYAIGHLYNPDAEGVFMDPYHPYSDLVLYDTDDYLFYKIGAGGVGGGCAWIELGPLIDQGTGGGSGGGGNGGDGNGNGGDGGGNGYGGENGGGGNGYGGKLYRSRSK